MRFDLGTLDSGERSLPFGLLVSIPVWLAKSDYLHIIHQGLSVSSVSNRLLNQDIWPWHIGLVWAIVALWATCLLIFSSFIGQFHFNPPVWALASPSPSDRTRLCPPQPYPIVLIPSMRHTLSLILSLQLPTATPCYPKPITPDVAMTRAVWGRGKPEHISAFDWDMPFETTASGRQQPNLIQSDRFFFFFFLPAARLELVQRRYVARSTTS